MDYSIYRLNLDVKTNRSQALLKVFKGDTAVKLVCMLTDGGRVFQLKDGNVATITLTMPDKSKPIHACYIQDNSIVYTFTNETTELGDDYPSGVIEAQLNVYGGVVEGDDGTPIYSKTLATPKFSIDVSAAENKPTNPIFEGINTSVGIVLGAAAKENARERAEEAREENEEERQKSYNNAINIAGEAKGIAEAADEKSNTAVNTANTASSAASNAVTASGEAKTIAGNAKTEADKAVAMVESASLSYDPVNGHLIFSYVQDGVPKPTPPIDLPLESAIINMEETADANGQPILKLELASGTFTEVKLDDIFRGFLKSNSTPNIVYANGAEGKETVIPVDADKYSVGKIVRRKRGGEVSVEPAREDDDAVPLGQARSIFVCVPDDPESEANKNSVFVIDEYGSVQNYPFDPDIHSLFAIRDEHSGLLVPKQPTLENHAASKYYVDGYVNDLTYRVDQLESASLKYTEFSGVTDAVPVPINAAKHVPVYKVGGMTYKSNNKLPFPYPFESGDYDGLTLTINTDKSITLKGTPKHDVRLTLYSGTIPTELRVLSFGTIIPSGVKLWYSTWNDVLEEWETVAYIEISGVTSANIGGLTDPTIALEANIEYDFTIYPMLADKEMPYEPYFKGLRDTKVTALRSEGANLIPFPYYYPEPKTINGVTWTPNADGSITLNGTQTQGNGIPLWLTETDPILFDGAYSASLGTPLPSGCTFYLNFNDGLGNADIISGAESGTKTINNRYCYSIRFWINAGTVFNNVTLYPMLNRGTTAVPYKPYRAEAVETLPISAALRTFLSDKGYGRGVEGYYGYIDFENKLFYPPRTYRKVFDGTESWMALGTNKSGIYRNGVYVTTPIDLGNTVVSPMVCNLYTNTSPTGTYYMNNKTCSCNAQVLHFYDDEYNTSDVSLWKAHLAELKRIGNPLIVEYATEDVPEPIDISAYLTDDEIEVEGGGAIIPVNEYNNPAFVECMFTELK
jgi:hypothetical protein